MSIDLFSGAIGDGTDAGTVDAYAIPTPDASSPGIQYVPYSDTYAGDNLVMIGGTSGNTNIGQSTAYGDFVAASAQGAGSTTPTPSTPSFLDTVTATFNSVAKNLATGKSATGTAAVDQAIAPLFGKANPGPMNTNTNLANKSLNALTTMLHQLNFNSNGGSVPGVGTAKAPVDRTVALVLAGGALLVVFTLLMRRG